MYRRTVERESPLKRTKSSGERYSAACKSLTVSSGGKAEDIGVRVVTEDASCVEMKMNHVSQRRHSLSHLPQRTKRALSNTMTAFFYLSLTRDSPMRMEAVRPDSTHWPRVNLAWALPLRFTRINRSAQEVTLTFRLSFRSVMVEIAIIQSPCQA
jgi:hypothetical protein